MFNNHQLERTTKMAATKGSKVNISDLLGEGTQTEEVAQTETASDEKSSTKEAPRELTEAEKAAAEPDPKIESDDESANDDEESDDEASQPRAIHFVATGLTGRGPGGGAQVFREGQELEISDEYYEATKDAKGESWLDLTAKQQEAAYGRVHFRAGRADDEEEAKPVRRRAPRTAKKK